MEEIIIYSVVISPILVCILTFIDFDNNPYYKKSIINMLKYEKLSFFEPSFFIFFIIGFIGAFFSLFGIDILFLDIGYFDADNQ